MRFLSIKPQFLNLTSYYSEKTETFQKTADFPLLGPGLSFPSAKLHVHLWELVLLHCQSNSCSKYSRIKKPEKQRYVQKMREKWIPHPTEKFSEKDRIYSITLVFLCSFVGFRWNLMLPDSQDLLKLQDRVIWVKNETITQLYIKSTNQLNPKPNPTVRGMKLSSFMLYNNIVHCMQLM